MQDKLFFIIGRGESSSSKHPTTDRGEARALLHGACFVVLKANTSLTLFVKLISRYKSSSAD
jgi:hypothetical protein